MDKVYEFDGQLFDSDGAFLDTVAHEYRSGDREYATDILEQYGFSIADINVNPKES